MRSNFLSTILAIVGVVSAACAPLRPAVVPASQERAGGILHVGQAASDVGTVDPHYTGGTQDRALDDMVFNGLIRFKPGDSTVFEPDLALALPQPSTDSAGKQAWTFALRKGVMCHPSDGVPAYEMTGEDVVYSFRKAANKDTSAYASEYVGMTFVSPEPYTVTITLDKPQSTALFYPRVANYSGGYIVCKQAAEKLGPDGLKTHPVGTGPFMFKDYSPKEKMDLVANDAYFRGKPQLNGVEYRYMADLSSRELGLRSGQLDVIYGLQDGKWVDQLSSAPNIKVDVFGVGEVSTLYFNTTKPPFDNPKVRQAVAYALNRDEFLSLYGTAVAQTVYSPVPQQFTAGGMTQPELAAKNLDYPYDPNKARQLLTEAGLRSGFSFSVVASEMPAYAVIYQSLQAQLARVGIKMDVKIVDHATMHDQIRKDVNPVVLYVAFRPTADAYLTQFLHSDSIVVTGKSPNVNFAHYDRIDTQIEAARNEPDAAKQEALWKQAQGTALRDMVVYPIQYANQVYARTANVDYGHELKSIMQLSPGIDETTRFIK
jgi:peptide/nickel transport system substrate-binding protein